MPRPANEFAFPNADGAGARDRGCLRSSLSFERGNNYGGAQHFCELRQRHLPSIGPCPLGWPLTAK